jgi:hypothetical protein
MRRRYPRAVATSSEGTRRPRRTASLLVACAALALASSWTLPQAARSANLGSGNSFNELTKGESETTTTPTATTPASTSSSTSNSGSLLFVGSAVAILLLGGIAFVIVRDARRVAPAAEAKLSESGSRGNSAARMRRRRAQAKAARQQRKRNR